MTSWYQQPMIAYDHSKCSQIALDIFLSLKHKYSKNHILHVFNSTKSGYILAAESTATTTDYLKSKFPQESKENSTLQIREQGSKSINECILESFISSGTTLLYLGFAGMKGFKPRSSDFSSRISQFVYESKISLAIIKRENPQTEKVLYCFDGSEIAEEGLLKANQFCQDYKKNLVVIHCTSPQLQTKTKHIKNMIKHLKTTKKQLKFDFICQQANLIDWIKSAQNDFEWVIVTVNGQRGSISKKRFVGHNTTKIIEQINANIFLLRF